MVFFTSCYVEINGFGGKGGEDGFFRSGRNKHLGNATAYERGVEGVYNRYE